MFARAENLKFDDNISVPTVLSDLDQLGIPLVPVLQNCTVPPIPDQHRCYAVGQALGELICDDLPKGMRVALLGSGGLSHEPGGARYYHIDEAFDRWFLELCESGDHQRLLNELTLERMEAAGSGGTAEVLSWVVVLGAIGPRRGRSHGYTVHTEFKCGIGGVTWDVGQAVRAAAE
jgi:aromatic ring-opening dioxygenase catalytic subunit (LigB family)